MSSQDNGKNTNRNCACLFEEFSSSSYQQWRAEAERLLRGASFDKKMITHTDEGITLQPIYRKEDLKDVPHIDSFPGTPPYIRGNSPIKGHGSNWEIAQEISYPDCIGFNDALQFDLKRGLTAVNLPLDFASRKGLDPDQARVGDVGYHGVSICSANELDKALKGIDLSTTPVYLHTGASGLTFYGFLLAMADKANIDSTNLSGAIAADPIGELAKYGRITALISQMMDEIAIMTSWAHDHSPKLGTIWIHGDTYHNAGANGVQELAFTLAAAVYYLRQLEERKVPLETIVKQMRFSFGAGSHLFMEIAKLRAARVLWNSITEECGLSTDNRAMWIHAVTSRYNKTVYDPYVNMLRSTTEAFSSAVGGADSLSVTPFDDCIRPSDEFSRRVARNTQVILKEEAHLAQTIDPAGGSWYVEKLTSEIADSAWKLFQEIEKRGGMYQALKDGFIQELIMESSRNKADALASRKKTVVGTNRFPNAKEKPLELKDFSFEEIHKQRSKQVKRIRDESALSKNLKVLSNLGELIQTPHKEVIHAVISAAKKGATVGEISKALRRDKAIMVEMPPLPAQRQSVSLEMLRRKIEKHQAGGHKTKVFIATLGPIRKYMPRLDFIASFFEVGGFQVVRTTGYDSPIQAADGALESGAKVVVICGLDEAYESDAAKAAEKIQAVNVNARIVLAGKPLDHTLIDRLTKSGVSKFIHAKSNVLYELKDIASGLGVMS